MSQKTPVRLDPGENQPIVIRRARRANLVFKFWNDRAFTDPHNIEDDFKFSLYKDSRDKRNPLIDESSIDGDLVIDGNEIRFPFDEDNSDIDLRTAYYELQNITTVQNWMQGEVEILTGEAPNKTGTEVNKSINIEGATINVAISAASVPSSEEIIASLGYTPANDEDLTNHVEDTSNPHGVTKTQVGLGNVDNTSDADKPVSTAQQTALNAKEDKANKGVANGYASLDSSGKVPSGQLPSYVDDVLEFADLASFPAEGETGKIYIAVDTNLSYRWSGSVYVLISSAPADATESVKGISKLYNDFDSANTDGSVTQSALKSEIIDAQVVNVVSVSDGVLTLDLQSRRDKYFRLLPEDGADDDFEIQFSNAPENGAYCVLEVVRSTNVNTFVTFPEGSNMVNSEQNLDDGDTPMEIGGTSLATGQRRYHYLGILFTKPQATQKYIVNMQSTRSFTP